MSIILSVKDLSIEYRASFGIVEAVKGISFDINKGESFVIVGVQEAAKVL